MNYRLLTIPILILYFSKILSQENLSEEALLNYGAGKFDEAIINYQTLISNGAGTSDIYYNLGCIYLKTGKISDARLNFERALRQNPSSADIKRGIAQTKARIEPGIESLPPFILYKWFLSIRDLFSKTGWGWLLLIGLLGLALFHILRLAKNNLHFGRISVALLVLVSIFAIMYTSRNFYERQPACVLISNHPLRVAPEENSQEALPLGEGTKLLIIDSLKSWYKVTLENNDEGWLPKSMTAKI